MMRFEWVCNECIINPSCVRDGTRDAFGLINGPTKPINDS